MKANIFSNGEPETMESLIRERDRIIAEIERMQDGKPKLPDSFCVLNDGSVEFIAAMREWVNNRWKFDSIGAYYGRISRPEIGREPFGTLLTIEQFKALTTQHKNI